MENNPSIAFKTGMRCLASGVSIISTIYDDQRRGLIATSVSSLSDDPPSLIICINKNASAYESIIGSRIFAVNILCTKDKILADKFSRPETRAQCFDSDIWSVMATGAPILKTATANLDCRVDNIFEYSTHVIVIGKVVETKTNEIFKDPLIYIDRHYRKAVQLTT